MATETSPAATATDLPEGETLERRLEELMDEDTFPPTTYFLSRERINEASLHAQAVLDPNAFWADQARGLHWDEPFTTVLDDSNPPFMDVSRAKVLITVDGARRS
jgi:acetyl-CoA synthetase